jgi:hypothetical protein
MPWDIPTDLAAFLAKLKAMGFDTVSLIVRPHQVEKMYEVLIPARIVREAGMNLLLRVWCDTKYNTRIPGICRLADGGLNIMAAEARTVVRDFCKIVEASGLSELATTIACSWSGSVESTAGEMPRYRGLVWKENAPDRLTAPQERTYLRAVQWTIGSFIEVFGNKTPIGGQRSSPWDKPEERLEYWVHEEETVNIWGDAWWGPRGMLPKSLLRAHAIMPEAPIIQEWDYDGWLKQEQKWKEDPKLGVWSELPWDEEFLARMLILEESGVNKQVVHCSPANYIANAAVFTEAMRRH